MQHVFQVVGVLLLVVVIIVGGWFGFWKYLEHQDNPIVIAGQLRPLDGRQIYRIVSVPSKDLPAYTYHIVQSNEPDSAATLAWRAIGQSAEPFLDKLYQPVHIQGEYYIGTPLVQKTKQENGSEAGEIQQDVVIRIEQIEIVR